MTGGWIFGGASVCGAAHVRRGLPNQDAVGWEAGVVAAVSDGHGAPAHYRSADGARLAVECALAAMAEADRADLPARVVSTWQEAVARHAARLAPAGDGWVESRAEMLLPYGATLVAAAVDAAGLVLLQIGDGDLWVGFPDERMERPLPDDAGLVGEQTHSLCAPEAAARIRTALLPPGPDFVLLCTDGVSKSFADEAAMRDVARHYRAALRAAEPDAVFAGLPDWLRAVSGRGSGDDATLCLGVRRPVPDNAERGAA